MAYRKGTNSNPQEFIVATTLAQEKGDITASTEQQIELRSQQREDMISITIPARGEKEFKFYLEKGATLEYFWKTDGVKLFFDLHAEPAGDTTGYFKSFKKDTDNQSDGTLVALFEGPHGWYWKNGTKIPVNIELKTKGSYQRIDKVKMDSEQSKPKQIPKKTTHENIDSL